MVSKRFVLLGIFALSVGAAFVGTLWNLQGEDIQGQLASGTSQVIDDGDPAFTTSGTGWKSFSHALGFKGDISSPASTTDSSLSATWTFSNVAAGQYKFFVTYKAYSLLTNQAPYVVRDGTSTIGSATVNQKVDPAGNTFDGKSWTLLGTYTVKGPKVSITLTRPQGLTANGMIADAARIERVGASLTTGQSAAPTVASTPSLGLAASQPSSTLPPTFVGNTYSAAATPTPSTGQAVSTYGLPSVGTSGTANYQPGGQGQNCPIGTSSCSCPSNMSRDACGEMACSRENKAYDALRHACTCHPGQGCADGSSNNPYCDCQPLTCPQGYHLDPTTYQCLPDSVCGDGYIDRGGVPREICEPDGNQGCPANQFCLNCTSCLVCGDTLLTSNEECEADYTCSLGKVCNKSCRCTVSSVPLTANVITIVDTSSNLMTKTTISSDVTRSSWTIPVRAGEIYEVYIRTQKYRADTSTTLTTCPINYWKVFNGSQRVLPLSSKLQYGSPLCYPSSSTSPLWVLLTQIQASSSAIKVEHEPTPLPTNGNPSDPARRLAFADAVRIVKTGGNASSVSSSVSSSSRGPCGNGQMDPGEQCDPYLTTFAPQCGGQPCNAVTCQCPGSSSSAAACAQEGEVVTETNMRPCCTGLVLRPSTSPAQNGVCPSVSLNAVCTRCGNGVCGSGENFCNCIADCPPPGSSSSAASSQPWTACPSGSSCDRTWQNNQCNTLAIDCAPGYSLQCNTTCGNTSCVGNCCRCVAFSSSSRSFSSIPACSASPWTACPTGYSCMAACSGGNCWKGDIFDCPAGQLPQYVGTCGNTTCSGQCGRCVGGSSASSSAQACIAEGQTGHSIPTPGDQCCAGLQTMATFMAAADGSCIGRTDGSFFCTALCGNGQCAGIENACNCPTDCQQSLCGNNQLDTGEQCDGSNNTCTTTGETCTTACLCAPAIPGGLTWTTVGDSYLVSTITDYALFGHGSYLYLVGGMDFWGGVKSELRSADGLKWTSVASLPQPLANAASLQVEGNAMLLGGLGNKDSVVQWAFATPNLLSAGFTSNPSYALPVPRYDAAALRVGAKTYLLGGYYKATPFNGSLLGSLLGALLGQTAVPYPSKEVYVHNGTSWSRLQPDLPFHVTKNDAFALGSKLCILDQSKPRKVYMSENGTTWSQVATLPAVTSDMTLLKPALHKGAIWLLGKSGSFAGSAVATTDGVSWQTVTGAFPSTLNDFKPDSAVSFQNELWVLGTVSDYYIGGSGRNGKVLKTGAGGGPTCGNGGIEGTEKCDDGNTTNGDGCDQYCHVESGWVCDGSTGQTSVCHSGSSSSSSSSSSKATTQLESSLAVQTSKDGSEFVFDVYATVKNLGPDDAYATTLYITVPNTLSLQTNSSDAHCSLAYTLGSTIIFGCHHMDSNSHLIPLKVDTARTFHMMFVISPKPNPFTITAEAEHYVDQNVVRGSVFQWHWTCGDNVRTAGEQCDGIDNPCSLQSCNDLCQCVSQCGNGIKEATELCDDGNTTNGDGCSSACQIESGWTCLGQPSVCNQIANSSSSTQTCAQNGQTVFASSQFGPTVCCSKNAGIKPNSTLAGDMCIATDNGSKGTCIDNWWQTCGNGTCGTGEDKCSCPQDCPACTPAGKTFAIVPNPVLCCPGLDGVSPGLAPQQDGSCPTILPGGATLCTDCGNGTCEQWENTCNCPADCKLTCAENGQRVFGSTQFGPTVCCSKNAGIKPNSVLSGNECIATNDGSKGTCIDNWWQTCGNGTCGTGEDKCSCPADCQVICPALTPPLCMNGILVPQLGPDARGCPRPPVCCEGANNPTAQCTLDLQCANGSCFISSCTCQ